MRYLEKAQNKIFKRLEKLASMSCCKKSPLVSESYAYCWTAVVVQQAKLLPGVPTFHSLT